MKQIKILLLVGIVMLFTACGGGGGTTGSDYPETVVVDDNSTEEAITDDGAKTVTLVAEKIAGPGGKLLYEGVEYNGQVDVPTNALVGVIKDSNGYLYHPAMGTNIDFSSESDKVAMGYFMISHHSEATNVSQSNISQDPTFSGITMKVLPNNEETELATKIKIKRVDNTLTITNNASRWAAVKIIEGDSFKRYYLLPINQGFDANILRFIENNSELKEDGMKFEDFRATALSVNVSSSAIIETYGASFRGIPWFVAQGKWPEGAATAWNQDHAFVLMLNTLDLYHTVFEGFKHVLGLAPLECVDIISGALLNGIEAEYLGTLTQEERIKTDLYKIWKTDIYNSTLNCIGTLGTIGIWEIFNTYWDIVGLSSYWVKDVMLIENAILYGAAYEKTSLNELDCFIGKWDRISYDYDGDGYGDDGAVGASIEFFQNGRWKEEFPQVDGSVDKKEGDWEWYRTDWIKMEFDPPYEHYHKLGGIWGGYKDNMCVKMSIDVGYDSPNLHYSDLGYDSGDLIYTRSSE